MYLIIYSNTHGYVMDFDELNRHIECKQKLVSWSDVKTAIYWQIFIYYTRYTLIFLQQKE